LSIKFRGRLITGHDTGRRLTEFFGDGITSYEWVYVEDGNWGLGGKDRVLGAIDHRRTRGVAAEDLAAWAVDGAVWLP